MTEREKKLSIAIAYCARCNFLPRATWVAQELLHTYGDFIAGLTLVPEHGGVFTVTANGAVLFSNKDEGRFPEIRELKEALNRFLEEEEVATLKPPEEGCGGIRIRRVIHWSPSWTRFSRG